MNPIRQARPDSTGRKSSAAALFGWLSFVFFLTAMMGKLIYFNRTLAIPNMAMNRDDYLVALGALLIAGSWTFWAKERWRPLLLLLLNFALTVLIFADLIYFRYFQDFITIPVLLQAAQVSSLGESIASLIHGKDVRLFLDWLILIPLTIGHARIRSRESRYQRSMLSGGKTRGRMLQRAAAGLLAIVVGTVLVAVPVKQATSTWAKGLFSSVWWSASVYNITGLLGFHGFDVYRYVKENLMGGASLSEAEMKDAEAWFAAHRPDRQGPASSFGRYAGSNVIIVQGEAFENFVIGAKVNGQEITPNLNALRKESLYFTRFFHQTGQGRTSDADFGVNAGLHPLPSGSVFIRYPGQTYDTLPAMLRAEGYRTGAFHAYDAGFWNRYIMYQNMGYDFFRSKKDYVLDEPVGWTVGDKSFFRQSVERMSSETQPFYSFLITLASHHPYKLPTSVQKLDVGPYKDTMFGDYLQSMHYVDEAVGEMIADLKQRGLWDKTIWVFYGDHDNSIGETEPLSRLLGHPVSKLDMLEMKNQVPLFIHLPDGAQRGTYDTVAGQLDVAPTLLHWLGIDAADAYMMGHNLLLPERRLVVLRNGSYTDGSIFYVPSADGLFEHGTCFDYAAREKTDVARCQQYEAEAKRRLTVSDHVITHNLIKRFRQSSHSQP
ncbi:LTA synthase family protein [Paenibacillus thiaminolyticus]|uniref:LTA synthase family protein n=1 Tax=Paenibacillus thiaminolyticus TaxID=49283 RepID=UPI002350894D|nr:LTA synthase family protein [Paenibacillus thiaminolyticus]WCR27288.1 LTA synthase family protein [Paenibacillus thiaminolyticus]